MSDREIRAKERSGTLTLNDLARAGSLVGVQVKTTEYGGRGGMHPGVWEVTDYTSEVMGFGLVGKRGKLLKDGPGKRYLYSMESFKTPDRVFSQLGATLLVTAGKGEDLATSKRERDNNREQTWVAFSGGTWRTMKQLCVVTATSKRKAQNAVKKVFPGESFTGQFGAHLTDNEDYLKKAREAGLREVTA